MNIHEEGRENGFALVAVLVLVAVAATLAAAALLLAQGGVRTAEGYAARIEGDNAARAAIRLTAIRLADNEGYGLRDAAPDDLRWNGWRVSVHIEDEAGKIDLNRADRSRIVSSLADMGVKRGTAAAALPAPGSRLVAVDDLAAAIGWPAEAVGQLRRKFTIHGAEAPQPSGVRSPLETYRIVAVARRGGFSVLRWHIVRLSPGFGSPFEWLERGEDGAETKASSDLPQY